MRYEILTPGQRIKKLRKKLGATQQDIVGTEYSRNTLTMIETHKLKLSYDTARIIADNMNKFARDKGIDMEAVTAEYLLESFDVQCDKIAERYIKELEAFKLDSNKNRFLEFKTEVDSFLEEYDDCIFGNRKFALNFLTGENLLKLFRYDEAYLYTYKAYDIVMTLNDIDKRLQVMALMIGICYRLNRITEIIAVGKHALNLVHKHNINNTQALIRVYYNLALAYKKKGSYAECLELIEKLLRLPEVDMTYRIKANILKANCLTENKQYDDAENLHLDILDEARTINDISSIGYTYWNLAYINLKRGNASEAEFYADHLVYLDGKNDTEQLSNNLYWATYIYKETDNYEALKRYFHRALNLLCKVRNFDAYEDLFSEVLGYFTDKKCFEDVAELIRKASEDLNQEAFPTQYRSIIIGKLYKGLVSLNINKVQTDYKELYTAITKLDS